MSATSFIILGILVLGILLWFKVSWFPKKPLGFRILHKQVGYLSYYKVQVQRPVFGWTGFSAFECDGSISSYSSWNKDRNYKENDFHSYLRIKGIPKDNYKLVLKQNHK